MKKKIRIGSRESALAVAQTRFIADRIERAYPGAKVDIVTMKTAGDITQVSFDQLRDPRDPLGIKGLFVRELEAALLDGRIDLAVHSLKDMPMEQDDRLPLVAFSQREDPRDVLVLPGGSSPNLAGNFDLKLNLIKGSAGCSSARRRVQLEGLISGCRVEPVRGNVITRLKKLDEGQYGCLILAAAGLLRLGLGGRISRAFSDEEMVPAAGQGILACQGRNGEDYAFLDSVRDPDAEDCARAERAFVKLTGGGCILPVAAHAKVSGAELRLTGLYVDEARGIFRRGVLAGRREDARRVGETLALRLMNGKSGNPGNMERKF